MTALLTLDDFASAVGDDFVITAEDASTYALTLVEARPLGADTGNERRPFALLFRGAPAPLLPQATYALVHERLGEQHIFIVPVGRAADTAEYEAIFT